MPTEYQNGFKAGYDLARDHFYETGVRHGQSQGAIRAYTISLGFLAVSGLLWWFLLR